MIFKLMKRCCLNYLCMSNNRSFISLLFFIVSIQLLISLISCDCENVRVRRSIQKMKFSVSEKTISCCLVLKFNAIFHFWYLTGLNSFKLIYN